MKQVMCLGCGTFLKAREVGDRAEPLQDRCPECDGTEFKDTDTDAVTSTETE